MAFHFRVFRRLFQPVPARVQPSTIKFTRSLPKIQMASITSPPPPPPGKFEWLVIIPDKPGTQQKRLEVRAQHIEGLKPYIESRQFLNGGAVLKDKPESDDPSKFDWYGSTVLVVAESKDEVKNIIENDIYTKSGVWDAENALILAAKYAFRN